MAIVTSLSPLRLEPTPVQREPPFVSSLPEVVPTYQRRKGQSKGTQAGGEQRARLREQLEAMPEDHPDYARLAKQYRQIVRADIRQAAALLPKGSPERANYERLVADTSTARRKPRRDPIAEGRRKAAQAQIEAEVMRQRAENDRLAQEREARRAQRLGQEKPDMGDLITRGQRFQEREETRDRPPYHDLWTQVWTQMRRHVVGWGGTK
jgi:hypothetical protein